jgi:hypothetical protein
LKPAVSASDRRETRFTRSGDVDIAYQVIGEQRRQGPPRPSCSRRVGEHLDGRVVLGSGFRFADCGSHVLKGVAEPWQLFAVEDP